ncbi:MAG: hypothetical protein KGJ86_07690 [Chloroflexota bacterium]|nr:hypothetical protein [Chloroflexota bacterium]
MELWNDLGRRVGLAAAQQFYDYVSDSPGRPAEVGRTGLLRGSAGTPIGPGFSRTVHYEITGAGRIDFQFHDAFVGSKGDPHPIVVILRISFGSH